MAIDYGGYSSKVDENIRDPKQIALENASREASRRAKKEFLRDLNQAVTALSKAIGGDLLVRVARKGRFNDYTGNLRYSFVEVINNVEGQSMYKLTPGAIPGVMPGKFTLDKRKVAKQRVKKFSKGKNGRVSYKWVTERGLPARVAYAQKINHKVYRRLKSRRIDKNPKRYLRPYESNNPTVMTDGKRLAAAVRRSISDTRSRRKVQIRIINASPYAARVERLGLLLPRMNIAPNGRRQLTELKTVVQDLEITAVKKLFRDLDYYTPIDKNGRPVARKRLYHDTVKVASLNDYIKKYKSGELWEEIKKNNGVVETSEEDYINSIE